MLLVFYIVILLVTYAVAHDAILTFGTLVVILVSAFFLTFDFKQLRVSYAQLYGKLLPLFAVTGRVGIAASTYSYMVLSGQGVGEPYLSLFVGFSMLAAASVSALLLRRKKSTPTDSHE